MNVGFKIDNCSSEENFKLLDTYLNALKENQPLEFGLECYGPVRHIDLNSKMINRIRNLNKNKDINLIIHLTLKNKLLNKNKKDKEIWFKELKEEIDIAESLNAKYCILHATSEESKVLSETIQINNIVKNAEYLLNKINMPIFIENTYEDLYFYEKLFEKLDKRINFVLDIGHMKIHSEKSFYMWLYFLTRLKEEGRKLHFHIHDNDGKADLHEPLSKRNDEKILTKVKLLNFLFPESNFILETHSIQHELVFKDLKKITRSL